MKVSEKRAMTAATVAVALRDLADKIDRKQSISVRGLDVTVPDDVELKLKYRHKHEREKLSFKLTWPSALADDFGVEAGSGVIDQYRLPEAPPHNLKQLKKEMQHSLYYFQRLAEAGESPSPEEIAGYRRLQESFADVDKPEWQRGVAEAIAATDELAAAAERRDSDGIGAAVTRLLEIKRVWHARYK